MSNESESYQLVLGQSITGAFLGVTSDARAALDRGDLHMIRYETKPKSADISRGILTLKGAKDVFISTKRERSSTSSEPAHFKGQHDALPPSSGEFVLLVDHARKVVRLEMLSSRSNVRFNRAPSNVDITTDPYKDPLHNALEARYDPSSSLSSSSTPSIGLESLLNAPAGSRTRSESPQLRPTTAASSASSAAKSAPPASSLHALTLKQESNSTGQNVHSVTPSSSPIPNRSYSSEPLFDTDTDSDSDDSDSD